MSTLTTTTTATTATVSASLQPQSADPLLTDLFASYYSARSNKRNTASQMKFERRLSENIISLYEDVRGRTYTPGRSICFIIHDPVQREIFAASFRDRIIHHYLYNKLEPVFEPVFILGFRHYGRYMDDFLRTHLRLSLNPRKTQIISCNCGVPFLGAVVCPNGRFLRSRTRRHLDRRWTEALCTEPDPYVLLSVRNAREGFLKHFGV